MRTYKFFLFLIVFLSFFTNFFANQSDADFMIQRDRLLHKNKRNAFFYAGLSIVSSALFASSFLLSEKNPSKSTIQIISATSTVNGLYESGRYAMKYGKRYNQLKKVHIIIPDGLNLSDIDRENIISYKLNQQKQKKIENKKAFESFWLDFYGREEGMNNSSLENYVTRGPEFTHNVINYGRRGALNKYLADSKIYSINEYPLISQYRAYKQSTVSTEQEKKRINDSINKHYSSKNHWLSFYGVVAFLGLAGTYAASTYLLPQDYKNRSTALWAQGLGSLFSLHFALSSAPEYDAYKAIKKVEKDLSLQKLQEKLEKEKALEKTKSMIDNFQKSKMSYLKLSLYHKR